MSAMRQVTPVCAHGIRRDRVTIKVATLRLLFEALDMEIANRKAQRNPQHLAPHGVKLEYTGATWEIKAEFE